MYFKEYEKRVAERMKRDRYLGLRLNVQAIVYTIMCVVLGVVVWRHGVAGQLRGKFEKSIDQFLEGYDGDDVEISAQRWSQVSKESFQKSPSSAKTNLKT